ncbi:unnamed protein product [Symbiodinium sp. CCMP2456]|nr:unnamed protein product [Symbiodinium sp. CCMP2456]
MEEEAQQRWNRALQLSPKATSDSLTRKGMQIPRVIGKAGAIIKELRQESGASVNILDKQLPEVLQRLQFHVAFVKGSHEAMHTAVVGLVRNARGPQALRALEPTEVGDTDVAFLVPAQCEPYLGEEQLTAETRCAIHVEVMEGLQKHRKVLLRAEETHDLQIVAWRLQELQIRMSQAALLVDRDFDLQDSAWAGAMEAFRAKRTPDGVQAASQQAAVPLERLPTLPSASEGIEQEARKSREAQQREVEAEKERERKRQIRETTAREQQECQNAAREAKMLADKARDMRLRAMEATSPDQHQSCIREAERYEEQARQARARSTRGYGTGPRAQQHEYQEDENWAAAVPKVGEDAEAQALRRRHEEREELRRESELRGQQAKENEAREREVLQRAVSSLAQGGGQVAHRSQGPVASPSTVEDRQARQSEILANSRAAPARAFEEASLRPAAVPPVATTGGGCLHGRPQPPGAPSRELQDVALFVCVPDRKAAEFLVSSRLGIGRRSGAKVSLAETTGSGPTLLECRGTPFANAVADSEAEEGASELRAALWTAKELLGPGGALDVRLLRDLKRRTVRRDMELLEEKLMRQVLRLQEQSERFMDIMMHPLEAKVAAMEGRQPVTDCSIAELRGNLRGLQESLEMQVRRAEQTETRLSKWRKSVEEDLQQKQEEMKRKFSEAVSNSDVVSRNELLELAKLLKQELRKVVDETLKDEKLATQQDLANVTASMRRELASVEKIAAGAAAQKALGQQELANAAEAVRAEMKTLTERAVAEEALTMEKFAALDAVEKASQESQNAAAELAARLAQCEQNEEELRLALGSQRGLPEVLDSQQTLDELVSRIAKCESLQEELSEQVGSPQRFKASEALEESHLSRRMSRLEQEQIQKGRQIASSIEALEAAMHEGLAKTEKLAQAAFAATQHPVDGSVTHSETEEVEISYKAAISERFTRIEEAVQALPGRLTKCEQRGEELEHDLESFRELPAALEAYYKQAQALTERVAQCEELSEAINTQAHVLSERVAMCEQLPETVSSKPQLLSERVAHCEELSEASSKQAQVLSERVTQCEQLSQAVDTLVARLEKCERHAGDGDVLARLPDDVDHPNLPGQAFAEDGSRALARVTSRLDSLEVQQRASEAGLATAKRLKEEMESSIVQRLEALEAEPTKKVDAAEPSESQVLSDTQLMLLDLQRRVSLLEHSMPSQGARENGESGEVVAVEPTPRTATLTHAAELMEQMELDLKLAREAAGLDSTPGMSESQKLACSPNTMAVG